MIEINQLRVISFRQMLNFWQMPHLSLNGNKFGDEGATNSVSCVHNVDKLFLENCQIGADGAKALAQEIITRKEKVNFLSNVHANCTIINVVGA